MGVSGLEYHAYVAQANFHLPFSRFTPVFVINYIFFTSLFSCSLGFSYSKLKAELWHQYVHVMNLSNHVIVLLNLSSSVFPLLFGILAYCIISKIRLRSLQVNFLFFFFIMSPDVK